MPITSHVVLGEGHADWNRLQSLFGLVRAHGGSETLAWTVQALGSLALAVGAGLAVAKPRAVRPQGRGARRRHAGRYALSLYVRLVVLAVAVAFLLRFALAARI